MFYNFLAATAHISIMLKFHTQMTAHNRVHYCTFRIVFDKMPWSDDFDYTKNMIKLYAVVVVVVDFFSHSLLYRTGVISFFITSFFSILLFSFCFVFLSFFWHRTMAAVPAFFFLFDIKLKISNRLKTFCCSELKSVQVAYFVCVADER